MSALYNKGRESFLKGEISWTNDNIKLALVDTEQYTANLSDDQYLDVIPTNAIIATSTNFTSKTTTNGVADASDIFFSSLTGPSCEACVIYQDTSSANSSRLIAYIDVANGLPITPNGNDVTITWSNGYNKIFKL